MKQLLDFKTQMASKMAECEPTELPTAILDQIAGGLTYKCPPYMQYEAFRQVVA